MKNQDSILIFGSSGQIGKSLIRKFTKNNYKVIAVTRSIHRKGYQIKTQSNYGYLELEEINSFDEQNISRLMEKASICINLIGILYEKKKNQFDLIHSKLPSLLSKLALKNSLKQFTSAYTVKLIEFMIDAAESEMSSDRAEEYEQDATMLYGYLKDRFIKDLPSGIRGQYLDKATTLIRKIK